VTGNFSVSSVVGAWKVS